MHGWLGGFVCLDGWMDGWIYWQKGKSRIWLLRVARVINTISIFFMTKAWAACVTTKIIVSAIVL